jgi:hypothetical protein
MSDDFPIVKAKGSGHVTSGQRVLMGDLTVTERDTPLRRVQSIAIYVQEHDSQVRMVIDGPDDEEIVVKLNLYDLSFAGVPLLPGASQREDAVEEVRGRLLGERSGEGATG